MTPQELVQQKRQAHQDTEPASSTQPAAALTQEAPQQQQRGSMAVTPAAAESTAEAAAASTSQADQSVRQHGQRQPLDAVTAQKRPAPGQAEAGRSGNSPGAAPMQTDYLFHFGDTTEIRKALEMPNRLTGYVTAVSNKHS